MSERAYWVTNNMRTETIPLTPTYFPKRLSEVGSEVLSASKKIKHTHGVVHRHSDGYHDNWSSVIFTTAVKCQRVSRAVHTHQITARELEQRTLFKAFMCISVLKTTFTHTLQLPTKSFSFEHTHGWMDGCGVNRTIWTDPVSRCMSNFLKSWSLTLLCLSFTKWEYYGIRFPFKGIVHVHPKKSTFAEGLLTLQGHPRCRWVCFFIRFGEMYYSITCSPMDPLQWMGAVRLRVQTADKNIIILKTSSKLCLHYDLFIQKVNFSIMNWNSVTFMGSVVFAHPHHHISPSPHS